MVTLKDVIHAAYGAKDSEGTLTQIYIQTVFISSNVSISVKILNLRILGKELFHIDD